MRLEWIRVVVGLGAADYGGLAFHEARSPTAKRAIGYEQLVRAMPALGWYRDGGASYNLIDSIICAAG